MNIACPHCQQTLLKATPSEDNHVRCSACGRSFEVALAVVTPPKLTAAEAPAAPAAPASSVLPPKAIAPLGPEPAPASYGLMKATTWCFFAWFVCSAAYSGYKKWNGAGESLVRALGPLSVPQMTWISWSLGSATMILVGIVLVALCGTVDRLDRRASWLAWRSGAAGHPLAQAPGSSLPYLLPFCASGGVATMLGLVRAFGGGGFAADGEFLDGLSLAWVGCILFLTGLACGELRRFFWRMGELARRIVNRTRGGETTLGEPLNAIFHPGKSFSTGYLAGALFFLFVVFAVGIVRRVEPLVADWQSGALTLNANTVRALFLDGALVVAIAGVAYTLLRLSRLWSEMLYRWEWAAATVDGPRNLKSGLRESRRMWMVAHGVMLLMACGLFIVYHTLVPEPIDMFGFTLFAAIALFTVLMLYWFCGMKSDGSRFCRAAGALAVRKHVKLSDGQSTARLITVLKVLLALEAAFVAYVFYAATSSVLSAQSWGALVTSDERWGLAGMVLVLLAVFTGLILFPYYFWALLLRDFDRAAMYLESAGEAA